ncbi:MAG: aldehyde dehydrogenase family protein, partial [Woeseiaceae bacterium]
MTHPATTDIETSAARAPRFTNTFADLKATFRAGRTHDLAWREGQLEALERMMKEREGDIIDALHKDLGRHGLESWTAEIAYVAGDAAYYRKNVKRWMKPRKVHTPLIARPGKSWLRPEPLGTVLIIGAWNYPLQLTLAGYAAAIAAGNCAVLKPSELSPTTSALIAKLIPEYMDTDCVRVVEGGVPETTALLELPFNHILYTGNSNVARIIMTAAAKNLTPVTLELGGKSPCVVLPDANLETAARRIAWGKYTNAGQTCIAPDYLLTDADTEARLLPLIEKATREMYSDNPETSDSYGRIINERHFDRVSALLQSGTVAIGGQSNRETKYIAPTVLTGVTPDSAIMQEEIFGPILPVLRAGNLDEAIEFIRNRDHPLAAYIFTNDSAAEARFVSEVSSGSTCINDTMMFMAVDELPFGGVGASGMGAYSGEHGFQ